MPPPQAACDIYRETLIPLKYGDALWEPGPQPDYRRVRLGDVGYIREGMFNLLFPAGISQELTTPGTDVPPSFETLDVGMILPRSTRPPGYLRTRTVKQVGVDVGSSFAVACPVEPGVKISFELTSEQGAVLVTNHPTYRENIRKWGDFEAYIKKHYDSWVDFARAKGYGDVKPVLVTGVDLTKQFAAIAYSDSQTDVECDFSVEAPALASASVSVWGSWRTQGLAHTTCGPDQYRTATRRAQHTYDRYVSESEIPEGNDQCVFIRYYTIRRFLGFKHLKAASGPHRLPEGDAGDDGPDPSRLEDIPNVIHNVPLDDRDSFDVVAEFICQRSGATSLLLHHDHIQDFIGENEEETVRLLEESAVVERVEVDENGVGQLVQATPKTNEFSRAAPENFAITDKTSTRVCSVNTESAALTVDAASTSGSLGVPPTNEKWNHISQFSVAIDTLNLAKETTNFMPARAVFDSASVLLVIIRDSAINRSDLVGAGLSCAEVCGALDEGLRGGRLDRHSQSVLVAINKLSTTLKRVREMATTGGKRNAISRLFHARADRDEIAAFRQDLEWVLHVFNPTHELASDSHDIPVARDIAGMTQSSVPVGELPPPAPRDCFGREEMIEKIVSLAENLSPVALVGAGGIGKTSIALKVLHHDRVKERFGDNRRFIRCAEFPASRANFLRRLSKAIGAGVENPEDLSPLRPFLSSREILIVLDGLEFIFDTQGDHAGEIYGVVKELSQFNNICLIVTSRFSIVPTNCTTFQVPTLSMEAARDTFNRIYTHGEKSDLVDNILEQLDFHPLSVTLLATVAYQNDWDNDRLVREWEKGRTETLRTEHNSSLGATIELSLASPAFRVLGSDAREVLEVVAFFPRGVNEENLEWLFPRITNSSHILDKFCLLSLTSRSGGFVTMPAPIRDYLLPRDLKSSPLLCTAKERYFTRLSADINPNEPGSEDTRWIITEDVNIEHLLDIFMSFDPDSDDVWGACDNFLHLLLWHKPRPTALRRRIEGLPDAHHFKPTGLFRLSRLADAIGNQQERKRLLTDCLKLVAEREDDVRVAQTLRELADANRMLGLCGEGIRQLGEALEIFERLGDAVDQAQCLNYLARLFQRDGQLNAAEEAATRAITLLPEGGQEYLVCQVHRTLGNVHHSKGEQREAIQHLETALKIALRFNWHYELFWSHFCLVEVFLSEDEFDEAQAHIDQANLHVVEDAYSRGRIAEIQAKLWYSAHRLEDAQPQALRALGMYETLGMAREVESCRALLQDIEEAMEVRFDVPSLDSEVCHPKLTPECDAVTQSQRVDTIGGDTAP